MAGANLNNAGNQAKPAAAPAPAPAAAPGTAPQLGQQMRGNAQDDPGFDGARARAKARLEAKQKETEKGAKIKEQAEARADQLLQGVDIDAIAKEVDADFATAEKVRSFAKMTPEAEKRLKELRERVTGRRAAGQQPKSGQQPNPQQSQPNAGSAGGSITPPASPANSIPNSSGQPSNQPGTQPASQPTQQGQPQTPAAPAAGTQQPQQPAAPLDEVGKRMKEMEDNLRRDFEAKFKAEQDKAKKLEEDNKKLLADKQKFEQEKIQQKEAERKNNFAKAAKAAGIPDDLVNFAYTEAQGIVNKNGAGLKYEEIFARMEKSQPSFFANKKKVVEPAAPQQPTAPAEPPKVAVRPGTGTAAGGRKGPVAPVVTAKKGGHDTFEDAKAALKKRAAAAPAVPGPR